MKNQGIFSRRFVFVLVALVLIFAAALRLVWQHNKAADAWRWKYEKVVVSAGDSTRTHNQYTGNRGITHFENNGILKGEFFIPRDGGLKEVCPVDTLKHEWSQVRIATIPCVARFDSTTNSYEVVVSKKVAKRDRWGRKWEKDIYNPRKDKWSYRLHYLPRNLKIDLPINTEYEFLVSGPIYRKLIN